MKKTLLLLFIISSPILHAQIPESLSKPTKMSAAFNDYQGSVYLDFEFQESSLIDKKTGTHNALLRYNIYKDIIEYKKRSGLDEIIQKPSIHAKIKDDYFYYCNFKTQRGLKRNGYYILVESKDNYRIYKRYFIEITDPRNGGISKSAGAGGLKKITNYYLEKNNAIMELPKNKREAYSIFSDKKDELKEYIKNEKIRLKEEKDLLRLVSKYHALKTTLVTQPQNLLSNTVQNN